MQKSICDRIRLGNYNNVAARGAGISEPTFYSWMHKGEVQASGIYHDFREAVEQAQAEAEMRNVAQIQAATRDNWTAAAWWLERKFSERWGRKDRHEHSGPGGQPIQHDHKLGFDFDAFTRLFDGGEAPPSIRVVEPLDSALSDPEAGLFPDPADP